MTITRENDVYFRVGVGMVIYKPNRSVCMFQRVNDEGIERPWQFPQGGTEVGESAEDALWREAQEEVGINKNSITKLTQMSDCICYQYGKQTTGPNNLIGRCNYWFFIRVSDDFEINLDDALEKEFTRYEWVSIDEAALRSQDNFHKNGYLQLATYFKEVI